MVQNTLNKLFSLCRILVLIAGIVTIPTYAGNIGALQRRAQQALDQGDIQGALQAVAQMGSNRRAQSDMYRRIAQVGTQLQQRVNTYVQQLHTNQAAMRTAQQRQRQAEQQATKVRGEIRALQQELQGEQARIAEILGQGDQVVAELHEQHRQTEQALQERLQQAEAHAGDILIGHEHAVAELVQERAQVEQQLQQAEERIRELEDVSGLERELAQVRQQYADVQAQFEQYREIATDLRTENETLEARVTGLQQEREAALEERNQAQQACARMEQQQRANAEANGHRQDTRIVELEQRNQGLQAALMRANQERTAALEERKQVQQQYAEIERIANQRVARIAELEKESDAVAHVLHYQQEQGANVETNSQVQDARIAELEQQNQGLQAHLERTQHALKVAKRQQPVSIFDQVLANSPHVTAFLREEKAAYDRIIQMSEGIATQVMCAVVKDAIERRIERANLSQEQAKALQAELGQMFKENRSEVVQEHVQQALQALEIYIGQLPDMQLQVIESYMNQPSAVEVEQDDEGQVQQVLQEIGEYTGQRPVMHSAVAKDAGSIWQALQRMGSYFDRRPVMQEPVVEADLDAESQVFDNSEEDREESELSDDESFVL